MKSVTKIWLPLSLLVVVLVSTFAEAPVRSLAMSEAPESVVNVTGPTYLPQLGKNSPARYLGVFIPLVDATTWNTEVNDFLALTGKGHAVYLISSGFDCYWANDVAEIRRQMNHIRSLGAMPLITWMPMDCSNGGFGDVNKLSLQDILDGKWDAYIAQWAADIAALDYPVFVRWGHEMNIPSYSWAGQNAFGANGRTHYAAVTDFCGLTACYGNSSVPDGPERYIHAYQRVHSIAEPIAPKIAWVWNPNARNYPLAQDLPWNHYNNYYPGDAYVDWVGLDGYNWGDRSGNGYGRWVTFDEMFGAELNDLAQRYPSKPQMIPEIGSVEDEVDPNRKAAFIRDAFQAAFRYSKLRVVIWVQDDKFADAFHHEQPGRLVDFRVNSSAEALQAYRQAILPWASDAPLR